MDLHRGTPSLVAVRFAVGRTFRLPVATTVLFAAVSSVTTLLPAQAVADERGWSLVPYVGGSAVDDQSAASSGVVAGDGELDIAVSGGFNAGLGLRYDYDSRWRSEIAWEYRSNDSDTSGTNGVGLPGGNYASNTIYLNGRYALVDERRKWTPYVGFGLGVIQEIDLDSEGATGERSFSDSGAIGWQVIGGFDRELTDRFYLNAELRYADFGDIELDEEGGAGRVTRLDYNPATAQFGIGWRF